jgi:hypothetical protein
MGVHKPASRSIPAPIATDCLTIASGRGVPISSAIPSWMRRNPATTLRRSSPLPGQPLGNMENKRCRKTPIVKSKESATRLESPKTGVGIHLFRGGLELDDSALQANGDGVGSVVCAEFREDILDVAFYSFLSDPELICNQFVCIPCRNQPENFDFP